MLYDQLKMWQPKIFRSVDFPPNLRIIMENLGEKIREQLACDYFLWELMVGGSNVSNITTAVQPFRIRSVITKDLRQKGFDMWF